MKRLFFVALGFLFVPVIALAASSKAVIKGTAEDSTISGQATLTEKDNGLEVEVEVANAPVGMHGFHTKRIINEPGIGYRFNLL